MASCSYPPQRRLGRLLRPTLVGIWGATLAWVGEGHEVTVGGAGTTTLTINKLLFGAHGTAHFTTSGAADYASKVAVRFKRSPDIWNGFIPHVTINGRNWAPLGGDNRLREYDDYATGSETTWSPTANAAPTSDQRLSTDRSLNSLKLAGAAGAGAGCLADGKPKGRTIDLGGHRLGLNFGGTLATGEHRHRISNGTLHTTRKGPFEFHIYGTGGLEVSAAVANKIGGGLFDGTSILKTSGGELIFSGSAANTFKGAVHITGSTLTLDKTSGTKGAAIVGKTIYIGKGEGTATLNIRGASHQINEAAQVFMHGGLKGAAVLRLEKSADGRSPIQNLSKLQVEGRGIIEFGNAGSDVVASTIGGGQGAPSTVSESVLILKDLDLSHGELVVRGWVKESTRILLEITSGRPSKDLLSKIRFEGQGATYVEKVSFDNHDYWEVKAEYNAPTFDHYDYREVRAAFTIPPGDGIVPPIPEPAITGALLASGAISIAVWRRW